MKKIGVDGWEVSIWDRVGDVPLEHDGGVEERGVGIEKVWMGGGKRGKKKEERLVDSPLSRWHGNWAALHLSGAVLPMVP